MPQGRKRIAPPARDLFHAVFEHAAVALAVVKTTGEFQDVNPCFCTLVGVSRRKLLASTVQHITSRCDLLPKDNLERLAKRKVRTLTVEAHCKNGKGASRWIKFVFSLLPQAKKPLSLIVVAEDITERKREVQSVRESEEKFAKAFRCSPQPFIISTVKEDRFLEVNDAFETITGYTREEALGHTTGELGIWENQPERDKLIGRALRGEKISNIECRFRKKSGEIFIALLSAEIIDAIAGVPCVVANAIDITEWRRTEQALRAAEKIAALYLQQTMFAVIEMDRDFRIVEWNPAAESIFGFSRDQALGCSFDLIVPAEIAFHTGETLRAAVSETRGQLSVIENIRKDGRRIVCDWFNTPLVAEDGTILGVMSLVQDITERKASERALKESEDRYRQLVESSHDWVWEVDADTKYTYAGPQCREILGYEPAEILGRTPFDLMSKAEAQRVAEVFGPIAEQKRPFRALENRNLHKNGLPVILETNGMPIIDADGKLLGYRGMDRDITEKKRAEIALRESETKYRSLAENLPGVVFQFYTKRDGGWGFYYVDENSRDLLGIEAEPLDTWYERFAACMTPSDVEAGVASIKKAVDSAGPWDFETKFTKPGGQEIYVRGLSKPQQHPTELIYHGILLDITDRKTAEKLLREVSGRLINVQEEERKRVARELHDGLGQSLALVTVELSQIARMEAQAELSSQISAVSRRVKHIASEITHVSHQLHPSNLQYLGITSALRSLCRETSEIHGIEIEFESGNVPSRLSSDVELCIYRIAQEALRNVVQHSKASNASIRVTTERQHILLTIIDKGIGFDPVTKLGGLGFVSIRERLRLMGGKVEIHSRPDRGTRIEIRVPLAGPI